MDAYALANLLDFAVEALNQVDGDEITGDDDRMVEALVSLSTLKAQTRLIEGRLQDALTERFHTQQAQVGRYRLERRGGYKRSEWDSDGVYSALIRNARVDRETGEVRSDAEAFEAFVEDARACLPLTKSLGWRTKPLRERDIEPDEFCEKSQAPYRFEVHVVDPAVEAVA